MDSKENNLEAHELKVPLNSNSSSKLNIDSQPVPQKCQSWHKLSLTIKTILILILCFIGLIIVSFSTCLIGRDVKICPLPNYSHKHMESYGECSTNDTIVEDMETELCFNEESSNTQGADVTRTLKSGWPACQGKLTFTNSNSEEKVYKLKAKRIRGFRKITKLENIVVVKLDGTCCVDIFESFRFRGSNKENLWPGSEKEPNFGKIKSFKYGYCNDY